MCETNIHGHFPRRARKNGATPPPPPRICLYLVWLQFIRLHHSILINLYFLTVLCMHMKMNVVALFFWLEKYFIFDVKMIYIHEQERESISF